MINKTQELFDEAVSDLKKKDLASFCYKIQVLHENMICNCFFRSQKRDIYKQMLKLLADYQDNENDYALNVAKGFIYLRTNDEKNAFKFLSKEIKSNKPSSFAFSLISEIGKKINPDRLSHAEKVVNLSPSPRGYFILANNQTFDNIYFDFNKLELIIEDGLLNFKKAIHLSPGYKCNHINLLKAEKYSSVYNLAIYAFMPCLKKTADPWAYIILWYCFDKSERYNEALEIVSKAFLVYPEDKEYLVRLGYAYSQASNFEEAISYYNKYLAIYPENQIVSALSSFAKMDILDIKFKQAVKHFKNGEYALFLPLFEKILEEEKENNFILPYYWPPYFISILKLNNPSTNVDESNPYFAKLDSLMLSFNQKKENSQTPSKNETNVNNLMIYYSNFKFGFGKYHGVELKEIIKTDPNYVLWCVVNIDHFAIDTNLFLHKNMKEEHLYLKALEYNLIKEIIIEKYKVEYKEEETQDDSEYPHDLYDPDGPADYSDYFKQPKLSEDWLQDEFGDDAETAFWNLD